MLFSSKSVCLLIEFLLFYNETLNDNEYNYIYYFRCGLFLCLLKERLETVAVPDIRHFLAGKQASLVVNKYRLYSKLSAF